MRQLFDIKHIIDSQILLNLLLPVSTHLTLCLPSHNAPNLIRLHHQPPQPVTTSRHLLLHASTWYSTRHHSAPQTVILGTNLRRHRCWSILGGGQNWVGWWRRGDLVVLRLGGDLGLLDVCDWCSLQDLWWLIGWWVGRGGWLWCRLGCFLEDGVMMLSWMSHLHFLLRWTTINWNQASEILQLIHIINLLHRQHRSSTRTHNLHIKLLLLVAISSAILLKVSGVWV